MQISINYHFQPNIFSEKCLTTGRSSELKLSQTLVWLYICPLEDCEERQSGKSWSKEPPKGEV